VAAKKAPAPKAAGADNATGVAPDPT
jgi:hypothetical protein